MTKHLDIILALEDLSEALDTEMNCILEAMSHMDIDIQVKIRSAIDIYTEKSK